MCDNIVIDTDTIVYNEPNINPSILNAHQLNTNDIEEYNPNTINDMLPSSGPSPSNSSTLSQQQKSISKRRMSDLMTQELVQRLKAMQMKTSKKHISMTNSRKSIPNKIVSRTVSPTLSSSSFSSSSKRNTKRPSSLSSIDTTSIPLQSMSPLSRKKELVRRYSFNVTKDSTDHYPSPLIVRRALTLNTNTSHSNSPHVLSPTQRSHSRSHSNINSNTSSQRNTPREYINSTSSTVKNTPRSNYVSPISSSKNTPRYHSPSNYMTPIKLSPGSNLPPPTPRKSISQSHQTRPMKALKRLSFTMSPSDSPITSPIHKPMMHDVETQTKQYDTTKHSVSTQTVKIKGLHKLHSRMLFKLKKPNSKHSNVVTSNVCSSQEDTTSSSLTHLPSETIGSISSGTSLSPINGTTIWPADQSTPPMYIPHPYSSGGEAHLGYAIRSTGRRWSDDLSHFSHLLSNNKHSMQSPGHKKYKRLPVYYPYTTVQKRLRDIQMTSDESE